MERCQPSSNWPENRPHRWNLSLTANEMRLAEIVCTIGPVSMEPARLLELSENRKNVARMNFPQVPHSDHGEPLECGQDVQGESQGGS